MNNNLSGLLSNIWVVAAIAFVVGVLLGWTVLGWAVFPVQYTNADIWDLNPAAKTQFVASVAEAFNTNPDVNLARERLRGFTNDEVTTVLRDQIAKYNQAGQAGQALNLSKFARAYGLNITSAGNATPAPTVTSKPSSNAGASGLLIPGLVILVVVAVAIGGILFARSRGMIGKSEPEPQFDVTGGEAEAVFVAEDSFPESSTTPTLPRTAPSIAGAPVARPAPASRAPSAAGAPAKSLGTFAATYRLGDDGYDRAFPLETARGDFMGECGMGISETVGEGKPDKVAAFDLWLFDKVDVRTATQVLMSEYAFNNQELRQRLAAKGELVLAEKGKHIILETQSLRVEATIVDLSYASTPGLPPNSHFQKLMVQLIPTQK